MSPATSRTVEPPPEITRRHWSLARRFAFRFAFVYILVYLLPSSFPATWIFDIPAVSSAYEWVDHTLVLWFGSHILHLGTISVFPNGSGDTTYNYVQLASYAVFALAASAIWSVFDRRRPRYTTLHEALRIYIRYGVAITLFSYGIDKVFKSQFPLPDIDVLTEPYGESSPMRLMWTFMGYSPNYTIFAGISEVVPALLLYFRRTTMIGAVIGAGVMTNVVVMNFAYDVPVKLYSTHLLLMCLFLLLPEFGRLANVFVLNRPVGPAQIAWPWQSVRRLKIARYIVKPLYVGVGLFIITNNALSAWKTWGDRAPFPPLYGMYQVEPGASPDTWRRVFVNRHHMFLIELADRSRRRMAFEDDGHGAVTLRQPTGDKIKFTYSRPDPDHLHIQGEFEKQRVDARLRKLPSADFLLLNRGFHWINEFPFNR